MPKPIIVDAHEDLAYNILCFGRDYTRSAAETRTLEKENNAIAPTHNGETLLGWDDYQRGRVGLVFATLFLTPGQLRKGDWDSQSYFTYDQAHDSYWRQLDVYHMICDQYPEKFRLILNRASLEPHIAAWLDGLSKEPVGLVPLMEGAEGVRNPSELEKWWERGVRIIGPAWGATRFCGGTRQPGPLTDDGRWLLDGMAELGFILDISHMDILSTRQALDRYSGPVIASHANSAVVINGYDGNRQLSDEIIAILIERGGIIGVIPFCNFLEVGWKDDGFHKRLSLDLVASHIDHICQLAGNARHVGLGSDFDGGFGVASVPMEIDTIADLQKIPSILIGKGYNDEDIALIMGGNWINHLRMHLP